MFSRLRGGIAFTPGRTFLQRLVLVLMLKQQGSAFAPLNLHHSTRPISSALLHPLDMGPNKKYSYPRRTLNSNSNMASNTEKGSNYNLAQDPSELFDIYPPPPSTALFNSVISSDWGESFFPAPQPTGKVKERGNVHVDGDWHRSVQVWIVQRDTQSNRISVLLQRRSPYKDTHPNLLDVSCAGHVNAGDDVLDTAMRELEEELGGHGTMRMYSLEDIRHGKVFTVTSAMEGETEKYGKFTCREYQDVFILWWKGDVPMETKLFAPLVAEEVSGFEVMDGMELIKKMLQNDEKLVPRSTKYVNALAKAIIREE
mmetsp:Transcript_29507/g.62627  ORF Transcript_29507/g.62627 Transcript_29507/m.62627 type:complete len:313 (+) Transcript_29507:206-1144(+)